LARVIMPGLRRPLDLVLGVDLPGALVDGEGAALEQAPDGAPAGDVVGGHERRLAQEMPGGDERRRGDDEQGRVPSGVRAPRHQIVFVVHAWSLVGPLAATSAVVGESSRVGMRSTTL